MKSSRAGEVANVVLRDFGTPLSEPLVVLAPIHSKRSLFTIRLWGTAPDCGFGSRQASLPAGVPIADVAVAGGLKPPEGGRRTAPNRRARLLLVKADIRQFRNRLPAWSSSGRNIGSLR